MSPEIGCLSSIMKHHGPKLPTWGPGPGLSRFLIGEIRAMPAFIILQDPYWTSLVTKAVPIHRKAGGSSELERSKIAIELAGGKAHE